MKLLCTKENIELADINARKHKNKYYGVLKHDQHREEDNNKLLQSFIDGTYKTSKYTTFKVYEPKERTIFRLPYYPDRIAHHAIMNVVKQIWTKLFIKTTYSSIEGRGIHQAVKDIKQALTDIDGTKYCLKLDIKKFYPSIDHTILKQIIRKKIKDKQFLSLLDEIIDSPNNQDFECIEKNKSVPIGNYLSQFFANLYLTYMDHYIKEQLQVKHYFRYADDIVILSDNKDTLRNILYSVRQCLHELKLQLKPNYQIYPVDSRGIDFVGYRFFHKYILLRKSIKNRLKRLINKFINNTVNIDQLAIHIQSYFGWLKYCNSKHLLSIINTKVGLKFSNWRAKQVNISSIFDKSIYLVDIDYKKQIH